MLSDIEHRRAVLHDKVMVFADRRYRSLIRQQHPLVQRSAVRWCLFLACSYNGRLDVQSAYLVGCWPLPQPNKMTRENWHNRPRNAGIVNHGHLSLKCLMIAYRLNYSQRNRLQNRTRSIAGAKLF